MELLHLLHNFSLVISYGFLSYGKPGIGDMQLRTSIRRNVILVTAGIEVSQGADDELVGSE